MLMICVYIYVDDMCLYIYVLELLFANDWHFPLVELARSDAKFLFELSLSLSVSDCDAAARACFEFSSLTLRDFPAEIFLQKLHIFNVHIYI